MAFSKDTKFVSSMEILARVKEELKSYFLTGNLDDLMFNTYVLDCLAKFRATYLPIKEAVMDIYDFKAELPCDFKLVREVWACGVGHREGIRSPFTYYYQTDCRINPSWEGCDACEPIGPDNAPVPNLCDLNLNNPGNCICASGDQFRVTHKIQTTMGFDFVVQEMLHPGNYKTINRTWEHSPNRQCRSRDSYDIMNNSMVTSFRNGVIFMLYYGEPVTDEDGYYDIPDIEEFKKYVYHYIRMMCYRQLLDQVNDESFNQVKYKFELENHETDLWYIRAKDVAMSQDIYDVRASIIRSYNRSNKYKIPGTPKFNRFW